MTNHFRAVSFTLILTTLLLVSCSPAATPTPVPVPTATLPPLPTATPVTVVQPLLSDEVRQSIQSAFAARVLNPVKALVFTDSACDTCPIARQLVEELGSLSTNISTGYHDLTSDAALAAQYNVDKTPAFAIASDRDYGILFFGLPSGREFAPFLEAIMSVSEGQSGLSEETVKELASLRTPLHIQVFVTTVCPYCPSVVALAHKMALQSEYIRADAVESPEFPELAQKYNVEAVPAIVINDKLVGTGQVDEVAFLQLVMTAVQNQ